MLTIRVQLENDRMDTQHEIWKVVFKFRNYFAPLQDPRRILDVGCGTGKWAIEVGMLHWHCLWGVALTFAGNEFPHALVTELRWLYETLLTLARSSAPTCRPYSQSGE